MAHTKQPQSAGIAETKRHLIKRWLSLIGKHFNHEYGPEETAQIIKSLIHEPLQYIDRAFARSMDQCKYFPHLADIRERLGTDQKRELPPWELPAVKYPPFEHKCTAQTTKVKNSGAWRLLHEANAYESSHVACPGERFPLRCPNCGRQQEPQMNPFIAKLMDIAPAETKGWNPWHKGHILCKDCSAHLEQAWKMTEDGWAKQESA